MLSFAVQRYGGIYVDSIMWMRTLSPFPETLEKILCFSSTQLFVRGVLLCEPSLADVLGK